MTPSLAIARPDNKPGGHRRGRCGGFLVHNHHAQGGNPGAGTPGGWQRGLPPRRSPLFVRPVRVVTRLGLAAVFVSIRTCSWVSGTPFGHPEAHRHLFFHEATCWTRLRGWRLAPAAPDLISADRPLEAFEQQMVTVWNAWKEANAAGREIEDDLGLR